MKIFYFHGADKRIRGEACLLVAIKSKNASLIFKFKLPTTLIF
jgi:hypothetical protein